MPEGRGTITAHVQRLLAAHPVVACFDLAIADCRIRIASNSTALLRALREYYRDWIVEGDTPELRVALLEAPTPTFDFSFVPQPPAPGKTQRKDESADFTDGRVLRKIRTGMVFLFGGGHDVAVGPCLANTNQVINFINNRFVQRQVKRGYLVCHAAGVCRGGRGLLIAGLAGRGKSTLALHLLEHDLSFVSNDRLLIRREDATVAMLGLPKYPRINPGTILNHPRLAPLLCEEERARFSQLAPEELWELEHKYDADINRYFGPGRFKLAALLAGIVILTWNRQRRGVDVRAASLADRPDLLAAVMKPPGVHFYPGPGAPGTDFSPAAYCEELAEVPVLEIGGGVDFDAAARACVAFLATGVPNHH